MQNSKVYTTSPLPFQGQKRFFLTEYKEALNQLCGKAPITTVIDLFGGSGLLAHTAKRLNPSLRVIYNDYDDFHVRLNHIPETNRLLAELRLITADCRKLQRLDEKVQEDIVKVIEGAAGRGFVDYITLSGSLLFSSNYATSLAEMKRTSFYAKVRNEDYNADGYLDGLEVVKCDYRELAAKYSGRNDVLFVLDPPYLSTDVSTYNSAKHWRLPDYLDILKLLPNNNYIYFTSNKGNLVELLEWMAENPLRGNPLENAIKRIRRNSLNYNSGYDDIMLFRCA